MRDWRDVEVRRIPDMNLKSNIKIYDENGREREGEI